MASINKQCHLNCIKLNKSKIYDDEKYILDEKIFKRLSPYDRPKVNRKHKINVGQKHRCVIDLAKLKSRRQ